MIQSPPQKGRAFNVSQKAIVGATRGRLWILEQNPSPQGEKQGYFPAGNPKNFVFRRATEGRPYIP